MQAGHPDIFSKSTLFAPLSSRTSEITHRPRAFKAGAQVDFVGPLEVEGLLCGILQRLGSLRAESEFQGPLDTSVESQGALCSLALIFLPVSFRLTCLLLSRVTVTAFARFRVPVGLHLAKLACGKQKEAFERPL